MFAGSITSVLALASIATAHFTLLEPEPRGNSFLAPASQWIYPCAGIDSTAESNRTVWPLTGGPVAYNSSHDSAIGFINLGLGTGQVSFNISLLSGHGLLNVTHGVLCLPDLSVPSGLNITDGTNASVQVITLSHSGASLYNCADITFKADTPKINSAACVNTTGITAEYIGAAEDHSHEVATNTSSGTTPSKTPSAAAGGYGGSAISTVVVGFAAVIVSYFL